MEKSNVSFDVKPILPGIPFPELTTDRVYLEQLAEWCANVTRMSIINDGYIKWKDGVKLVPEDAILQGLMELYGYARRK